MAFLLKSISPNKRYTHYFEISAGTDQVGRRKKSRLARSRPEVTQTPAGDVHTGYSENDFDVDMTVIETSTSFGIEIEY